ncbi:hypothetical protein [Motilimonas sp. E26]|nr:hypothetical protein [Motilimonas sp. E26]
MKIKTVFKYVAKAMLVFAGIAGVFGLFDVKIVLTSEVPTGY